MTNRCAIGTLLSPRGPPAGLPEVQPVQQGDCSRRVPAPGLSRRHPITRPHSQNSRVLPQPAPGPDAPEARVRGPRAYPREARSRGPPTRRGPGARLSRPLPASSLSSARPWPPGGSGSLSCSSRPGGTPAHAVRFGFGASSSSCCCRPPADLALPLGVRGSGTRGSSGGSGRSGSAAIPPVRGPSLGGAWLKTHWSHWLRANGGGGRAGPGAAEPSAAVDEGTDAAAAVRPLAMAPGGEAARTAPPH